MSHYTDAVNWIVVVSLIGAAQGCFIAYRCRCTRQNRANPHLVTAALLYVADALTMFSIFKLISLVSPSRSAKRSHIAPEGAG